MSAPLLLIDAGNTRLKWATTSGKRAIRLAGAISTQDATGLWIAKLVREFKTSRIVLASVVPQITRSFLCLGLKHLHVVTGISVGRHLEFDYPNPVELGADRLSAAVAARVEGIFPAIVINCGTATAFTVLDHQGRLCGGAIAPGLQTQLAALLGATAQLPATKLAAPRRIPARSTREAIRAGVMLNFQGGAKEIVRRLSEALTKTVPPRILLTGGHARHLVHALGVPAMLRPLLVFQGLRIMGTRVFNEGS